MYRYIVCEFFSPFDLLPLTSPRSRDRSPTSQPAASFEAAGAFGGAAGTNPLFAGLEPGAAALTVPTAPAAEVASADGDAEAEVAAVQALLDAMPKLGRYLLAQSVA